MQVAWFVRAVICYFKPDFDLTLHDKLLMALPGVKQTFCLPVAWKTNWNIYILYFLYIERSFMLIDPIHKWQLFYFCSVIVQISLPGLALEQEFFSI